MCRRVECPEMAGRFPELDVHYSEPHRAYHTLQDIDLHILGAPAERYAEYEAQIRREYRFVPKRLFRGRRARLLRARLESEALYHTAWFREHFESPARRNLAAAWKRWSEALRSPACAWLWGMAA